MDYKIFAMQDKVAVKLTPPEERIGNILLPDTAKGDNHIGTIMSVGIATTGVLLQVGDLVVVPRYAGSPVKIDGEELLFMKSTDEFAHGLNERVPVAAFYAGLDHWYVLLTTLAGTK